MGGLVDSFNLITFGTALVGFTILYYGYHTVKQQKTIRQQKKLQKKNKFVLPNWAIKKAKELEPPELTKDQIESSHERKPPEIWNNILIFPDLTQQRPDSSTKQLLRYFREAKTSIYVCMYLCSNYTISHIIRDKYDEGLIVKVLSEFDTWTAHNSKGIKDLAHHGIDVRLNKNGFMMHNKFSIIDEEAVLTGSLNWTRQGVESNCENVLVSIDPRIVSKYLQEFNKLYYSCKRWDQQVSD